MSRGLRFRPARIPGWTLRHPLLVWCGTLGLAVAAFHLALPRLEWRFSLRELFQVGHPAREAYDRFQWAFELGPKTMVYFHGPGVFSPAFLAEMVEFSARLRAIPGTRQVFSAVDLVEPGQQGEFTRLRRILRPEVTGDPARLAATLAAPPFTERWHGLLYDRSLSAFAVSVTPPEEDQDPFATRAWLARIRSEAEAAAAATGTEAVLAGDFFVHQEVRRAAIENQIRLTRVSALLQGALVWLMFGSPWVALQLLLVLGLSILFAFAMLAVFGIPLNMMSASFAVLILTIGTSDLIHMLGRYASYRRRYGRPGAALRSVVRGGFPVFLNTVTTSGCVLVGATTELSVVRQFSLALAVGCWSAWAVTVLLAPTLFVSSGIDGESGLFFRIQHRLERSLEGGLGRLLRRAWLLPAWIVLTGVALWAAGRLEIDSNWYRYFRPGTPVADSLEFCAAKGFPVSMVDLTVPTGVPLAEALADPALGRDLALLEAEVLATPGVTGVFGMRAQTAEIEDAVGKLRVPEGLAPVWAEARRNALRRDFLAADAYAAWYSDRTYRTRLLATSTLESSRQFHAMAEDLRRRVAGLRFERLDGSALDVEGQAVYWAATMDSIPRTFLSSLGGSVALVALCFWWICGSFRLAILAIIPNVVPLFFMFAAARWAGITLNETVCLVTALAEGIAVDDTVHFLYHYSRARDRGRSAADSVAETFHESGAAIVVTASLFATGFGVCLLADVAPLRQMGFCLVVSVVVAAVAELVLVPALLLGRSAGTGEPTPEAPAPAAPEAGPAP